MQSERKIELYINGQALSLVLRYDEADSIIETWKERKFGIVNNWDDDDEEILSENIPSEKVPSENSLLEIRHTEGTLYVDIKSLDAINYA